MWAVEWDQRYEAPMASSVAATGASLQVFSTLSVSMIHYLVSSRTKVEPDACTTSYPYRTHPVQTPMK